MINPKLIQTARSIVAAIVPFLYALGGGVVASKCSNPEPVTLVITNQQYEKQISESHAKIDSISRVLPTMYESIRYLSKRYGESGKK
jgi:hypothetical protein